MIRDLLKTPQQIREERQNAMRERSAAQAALLSRGASGASTALPGLLRGFAAQQLVEQGPIADNLVRGGLLGLSSIAGAMPQTKQVPGRSTMITGDGQEVTTETMREAPSIAGRLSGELARASMTPEERQAAVTSSIARQAGTDDPEKLRALADRLRTAGRPDAAEQFDERATKLETAAREQAAKSALTQDLINAGTPEARQLAVAYAAGELTYNQVLDQMEKQGIPKFDLSTTERKIYEDFAFGDSKKNIEADPVVAELIESVARGEPGAIRAFFGLSGSSDEDMQRQVLLQAAELAEKHRAKGAEGEGKTQYEALQFILNRMLKEKEAKFIEAQKKKEKAQTPINVPGLNTVDPNAGISEDQLNIGGA